MALLFLNQGEGTQLSWLGSDRLMVEKVFAIIAHIPIHRITEGLLLDPGWIREVEQWRRWLLLTRRPNPGDMYSNSVNGRSFNRKMVISKSIQKGDCGGGGINGDRIGVRVGL